MRLQPSQSCISGVLHSKHTQAREHPSQECDGTRYKKTMQVLSGRSRRDVFTVLVHVSHTNQYVGS